jgi:hypothetical protein
VQVTPQCIAASLLSDEPDDRIYDLSLQPPWMEDPGGSWVAGISHNGHVALWDTNSLESITRRKASTGAIFSCCALPGCALE